MENGKAFLHCSLSCDDENGMGLQFGFLAATLPIKPGLNILQGHIARYADIFFTDSSCNFG